jgi:hypothetical protein
MVKLGTLYRGLNTHARPTLPRHKAEVGYIFIFCRDRKIEYKTFYCFISAQCTVLKVEGL